MKLLLLSLTLLTVTAIAQEQPRRHDKYKDDPVAYCWNPRSSGTQVKAREANPHAHKCNCKLMCNKDQEHAWVNPATGEIEDQTCELFCTLERCTCHVEEPCENETCEQPE